MAERTEQTIREMMRRQECKFESGLLRKLLNYRKSGLLAEAATFRRKTIISSAFVPVPNRIDHRRRQSRLCWFCGNHSEVLRDQFGIGLEAYHVQRVSNKLQKPNTWAASPPQESERYRGPDPSFLEHFLDGYFSGEDHV
jgi:hypothetical protein